MATAIDHKTKHPDEIAEMLASSANCGGTCTYTTNGSTTTVSGSCGGSGCPTCPEVYSQSTIGLVKKLPKLILHTDTTWSVPCGLSTAAAPVLKLFDEYALLHDIVVDLKKKANLYRALSVVLGVVSLLSIGGLIYTLVSR